MEYRIETLSETKLIGKRMAMSFSDNKTGELWRSFMQRRNAISDTVGSDLYSMQIYRHAFFEHFDPNAEFEKWATIAVTGFENAPADMETFVLRGGLYAVFPYKGDAKAADGTFRYILGTWLSNSGYILDDRPHFEILGEKYKKDSVDSEEEIWIPIRTKTD
ncbi:MAG TPA: GyrI-like domain-containing protein [Flavobacterium sp.]|nr:GyrI-like domain-containing protein [Flavobacterium sp.]